MKGLILYDLYHFKALYWKNLLLVGALYLVLTLAMRMTFLIYFLIWMTGVYAMGLLSGSEGWERFVRALPVSAQTMAGAKLLTMAIIEGFGVVYALVVGGILTWITGEPLSEHLMSVFMIAALALTMNAVMLPCALKWGVERTRNTLLLFCVVIFAAAAFFGARSGEDGAGLAQAQAWFAGHLAGIAAAFIALAVMVCAAGWYAAAHVYARREV